MSAAQALDEAMEQRDLARHAADIDRRLAAAKAAVEDAANREDEARQAAAAARDAWLQLFPGVSIAPVHLQSPREALLLDIEQMRRVLSEVRELEEDRGIVQKDIHERLDRARGLRDRLGLDSAVDEVEAIARESGPVLEAADQANRAAQAAVAEIANLRDERRQVSEARDAADTNLAQLEARLAQLDASRADPDVGLERLERARDARDKAQRTHDDLDRETPDWQERVAEADRLTADGTDVVLSIERRAELEGLREGLDEEANRLSGEKGGLDRDVAAMEGLPGPAHVQGAIEQAQAELADVHRAHDRLALLAAAVAAAERAYRDEHQSPLLGTASGYLAGITDGRYDRLIADDTAGDGATLHVRRSGEDFPWPWATPSVEARCSRSTWRCAWRWWIRWRARTPSGCPCSWTRCS